MFLSFRLSAGQPRPARQVCVAVLTSPLVLFIVQLSRCYNVGSESDGDGPQLAQKERRLLEKPDNLRSK